MEKDGETTSLGVNGRVGGSQERGVGGKMRRPPTRKPAASPYARPAQRGSETGSRRWLSKLVDPAYRLIAGGANLILPSFFSRSASTSALNGPSCDTEHQGKTQMVEQCGSGDDRGCNSDLQKSKTIEMEGPSGKTDKLKSASNIDKHNQNEKEEHSENNGLSEIEQILKGKIFSRNDTNRLMDILKSRAVDLPHIVHESENPTLFDVKDSKGHEGVHELPRISTQQKQENLNGSIWGTTTPLFRSKDEISASPAEIARAYMGSRTSEAGPIFKSMVEKGESSGLRGDDAAIKPYVPSPSAKSSTCWPGAMVQDAYLTPRSQRGRYGLHNFSRTPYSRTIFSKSKPRFTQMQGEYNHIPSTPSHQSETPIYGQVKLRTDTLEGGYGSVGPIRRTRNKIGAESSLRRSAYFHSSINGPSQVEKFNALPGIVRNLEPGETSGTPKFPLQDGKPHFSEVGVPTVHSHTSLIARQILEHIDRNPPTPKEKSDELKLTIKWKKPDFSDVSTVLSNEKNGLVQLRDFGSHKYIDGVDGENPILNNKSQGNSDVIVPPPESDHRVNDVLNKGYTSSEMNFGSMLTNNGRTTADFISTPDLLIKPTYEDVTKIIPDAGNFDVNLQQKPLLHTSVMKPLLPSISVNNSRWMFASDNSSGFTFPVSASSSVLSEPPTPSIVPSFSAGGLHPSKEESTIPTYSFGSKRTSAPLAFTFPSTSTATVQDDACDIKFSFGSDEKTRLSFSSFGKNAICY